MSLLRKLCDNYVVNYFRNILRRITRSGLGLVWVVLAIAGLITGITMLVGIVLGIAIGLPALVLLLAWNWVVPVFGGPTIGYWTAVGLVILLGIVGGLTHK